MSNIQANVPESSASLSPRIENLTPITISERIDAMDILRGLALIGILLMNIEWFNRAISSLGSQDTSLTGLDHAIGWLIRCFVEGKFYTLFALLFGMGFAVMLIRAKAAKRPFGAWFSRRMLVLMVFGFLHMVFLWGGDILHDYGFTGLLLLAWVTLLKKPLFKPYDNPTSFLKLALVWLSVPILLSVISGIGFGLSHSTEDLTAQWHEQIKVAERVEAINLVQTTSAQQNSEALTTTQALIAASTIPDIKGDIESSSLASDPSSSPALATTSAPVKPTTAITDSVETALELFPQASIELQAQAIVAQQAEMQAAVLEENKVFTEGNYWQATEFRLNFALFMLTFTLPFAFTMLLPIFILGYWLVSSSIMKHYQEHALAFKIMAYLGLGLGTVLEVGGLLVEQHPVAKQVMLLQVVGETLFFIGQFVMTAGYFGLIMALLTAQKWRKRLAAFIPMGRMALTNYIMHSVILTTIFYGYAGGYFGEISRAPQMLIAFAIIVLQLRLSRWWLTHYAFGPLEWLWRCLSYKKIQTMRL
ncbi:MULTISPECIES: DUF418 domain-containing protein [unclassified Colwellia]|uniref:DUF418 domain-containing protein n=1 Tax=unclassified Colwellia TaxID=196834 RepID=UPI0021756491|nr:MULTISPECIES: DUF418 domain-containing protein [unclassified Colwellia]